MAVATGTLRQTPVTFRKRATVCKYVVPEGYPDAPANLYESVYTPRVRHTADVLVSLRDGYYYGASHFSRMVRLLATHGNALRASTSAFLMSTHRDFPTHVRSTEARPFLRG